jgi:hypothetical protein
MTFIFLITNLCSPSQEQITNTVFLILLFPESINDDTKDKADTTIDQDERHMEDLDVCVVCVNRKIFILLRLIILAHSGRVHNSKELA